MAKELGYFEERRSTSATHKQASWPATRDALQSGEIDAAHCLYTMPFSVATRIGGNGATDLKIAMMLSNNGQGITLANDFAEVGYGDLKGQGAAARQGARVGDDLSRRHPRPVAALLVGAGGRRLDVEDQPLPPPQMIQNMTRRNDAGLLRRRTVERGGGRPGHRLHDPRDAGPVAQPPREGAGRQRAVRAERSDSLRT